MKHSNVSPENIERSNIDRHTAITNIVTQGFEGLTPEVILPLGGGIIQRADGRWETAGGNDADMHGSVTIARARIVAGTEIGRAFPDASVVTNSFNRFNSSEPTMASVARDELVRRGIPKEKIILEEESFSTVTQYVEMIRMAVDRGWSRLAIIINNHYAPRATALYQYLDTIVEDDDFQQTLRQFHAMHGTISFIEAEQILDIVDKRYTRYFEHLKQTDAYQMTVQREAQGLHDLELGNYRVRLQAEAPRDQ